MSYMAVLTRTGVIFTAKLCDSLEEAQGYVANWKSYIGDEDWDVDSYEAKIFKEIGEEES